jgi:hypothetical protein
MSMPLVPLAITYQDFKKEVCLKNKINYRHGCAVPKLFAIQFTEKKQITALHDFLIYMVSLVSKAFEVLDIFAKNG